MMIYVIKVYVWAGYRSHYTDCDTPLNAREIAVRLPTAATDFSLLQSVQTGSGAQPASYSMGTEDPFPEGKAAVEWS